MVDGRASFSMRLIRGQTLLQALGDLVRPAPTTRTRSTAC